MSDDRLSDSSLNFSTDALVSLMKNRRTAQSYSTEAVPLDVIRKAIEVAAYAPNHRMTFPWRFFLLGSEARSRLAAVQVALKASKNLSADAQETMQKKLAAEGTLIVAGLEKNADPDVAREDYASFAMALQNMSLYFWSKGYGSKWGSGKTMRHPVVYELIERSTADFEVCALFWVGRMSGPAPRGLPRPAVDEIFRVVL